MKFDTEEFFTAQMESWPLAKANYEALANCRCESVMVKGMEVKVMFNPARIRSSAAAVDSRSIANRRCFLCSGNRPLEQKSMDMGDYELLVNPYPVFDRHFTIASKIHTPQSITGRVRPMLRLAAFLSAMTVFFNGAACGASAPDHQHFQAVPTEKLPLMTTLDAGEDWTLGRVDVVEGADPDEVASRAEGLLWSLAPGEEPDVNLYARVKRDGRYQFVAVPRSAHRPHNYGDGEGQILVSPASVEMAGVVVAPRESDYQYCLNSENLAGIYDECGVAVSNAASELRPLSVGIVRAKKLEVKLTGQYNATPALPGGMDNHLTLTLSPDGMVECEGKSYASLLLTPDGDDDSFTLSDVVIGIDFHWEQKEDQSFHGSLLVKPDGDALQAVNIVDVETYLRSVVSSEMNANAPEEFLKAHAVISRSWVLAQIMPPAHLSSHEMLETAEETVKWYDRDAHTGYDICADDHCQRYQGCTKASTPQVEAALEATRGEVLTYGNELCDARFSKCCGGVSELFSTCWQPVDLPYLQAVDDPFCGRASADVLSRVLNHYDQTTTGYYRWEVNYTAKELSDIIRNRSGVDHGEILALEPLHRGPSGRIDRLRIRGTKLTRVIGKELEIRRTLSESHLYSSAFTVHPGATDEKGVPQTWTLKGNGWGHGVGLCQIGAAVMAAEGYGYRDILKFYFPGASLVKIFD